MACQVVERETKSSLQYRICYGVQIFCQFQTFYKRVGSFLVIYDKKGIACVYYFVAVHPPTNRALNIA
jgi:hypothetical protein